MEHRPLFSIAHASARPNGWKNTCELAQRLASYPNTVEYVLSVDERFGSFNNPERTASINKFSAFKVLYLDPGKPKFAVPNWNNAIDATTGEVIIINSDDFNFPNHWDVGLSSAFQGRDPLLHPFVVRVSTGAPRDKELFTIQIFSRAVYNLWGYGLWPEYESLYSDDDFTQHAYSDSRVEVIAADHLLFEHMHFAFGKSERDAVYDHENRSSSSIQGAMVFQRRKARGFR